MYIEIANKYIYILQFVTKVRYLCVLWHISNFTSTAENGFKLEEDFFFFLRLCMEKKKNETVLTIFKQLRLDTYHI